jgi:hypothetical protein
LILNDIWSLFGRSPPDIHVAACCKKNRVSFQRLRNRPGGSARHRCDMTKVAAAALATRSPPEHPEGKRQHKTQRHARHDTLPLSLDPTTQREFPHSGAADAFLECSVTATAATKTETKMHTRRSQVRRSDGQATAAPTDTMEALSEADLGQVTGGNGSGPRSSNPVEDRQ